MPAAAEGQVAAHSPHSAGTRYGGAQQPGVAEQQQQQQQQQGPQWRGGGGALRPAKGYASPQHLQARKLQLSEQQRADAQRPATQLQTWSAAQQHTTPVPQVPVAASWSLLGSPHDAARSPGVAPATAHPLAPHSAERSASLWSTTAAVLSLLSGSPRSHSAGAAPTAAASAAALLGAPDAVTLRPHPPVVMLQSATRPLPPVERGVPAFHPQQAPTLCAAPGHQHHHVHVQGPPPAAAASLPLPPPPTQHHHHQAGQVRLPPHLHPPPSPLQHVTPGPAQAHSLTAAAATAPARLYSLAGLAGLPPTEADGTAHPAALTHAALAASPRPRGSDGAASVITLGGGGGGGAGGGPHRRRTTASTATSSSRSSTPPAPRRRDGSPPWSSPSPSAPAAPLRRSPSPLSASAVGPFHASAASAASTAPQAPHVSEQLHQMLLPPSQRPLLLPIGAPAAAPPPASPCESRADAGPQGGAAAAARSLVEGGRQARRLGPGVAPGPGSGHLAAQGLKLYDSTYTNPFARASSADEVASSAAGDQVGGLCSCVGGPGVWFSAPLRWWVGPSRLSESCLLRCRRVCALARRRAAARRRWRTACSCCSTRRTACRCVAGGTGGRVHWYGRVRVTSPCCKLRLAALFTRRVRTHTPTPDDEPSHARLCTRACALARLPLCCETSDMPGRWAPAPLRCPSKCNIPHTHA